MSEATGNPLHEVKLPLVGQQVTSVKVSTWPAGVDFPEDLAERIWYDASTERLCLRGFMSKSTYDRLCKCSADPVYLRALEALFRASAARPATTRRRWLSLLITIGSLMVVGAVLLARLKWGF